MIFTNFDTIDTDTLLNPVKILFEAVYIAPSTGASEHTVNLFLWANSYAATTAANSVTAANY